RLVPALPFCVILRIAPQFALFPYTTLFRSPKLPGYFVLMILGKKFAIVTRKYQAITMVDYLKGRYQSKWVVLLSSFSIIIFLFRSEEHTSELQSRFDLVCRHLLEKKKYNLL